MGHKCLGRKYVPCFRAGDFLFERQLFRTRQNKRCFYNFVGNASSQSDTSAFGASPGVPCTNLQSGMLRNVEDNVPTKT